MAAEDDGEEGDALQEDAGPRMLDAEEMDLLLGFENDEAGDTVGGPVASAAYSSAAAAGPGSGRWAPSASLQQALVARGLEGNSDERELRSLRDLSDGSSDVVSARRYVDECLPLRVRCAGLLGQPLDEEQLRREARMLTESCERLGLDLERCVPELSVLAGLVRAYDAWQAQHRVVLEAVEAAKTRGRGADSGAGSGVSGASIIGGVPLAALEAALREAASALPVTLMTRRLALLRAQPAGVAMLEARAQALLDKLAPPPGPAAASSVKAASSKALARISHDSFALLRDAASQPVWGPALSELRRWSRVAEWRKQVAQALVAKAHRSRIAEVVHEGGQVGLVPAAETDAPEVERLAALAAELDVAASDDVEDRLLHGLVDKAAEAIRAERSMLLGLMQPERLSAALPCEELAARAAELALRVDAWQGPALAEAERAKVVVTLLEWAAQHAAKLLDFGASLREALPRTEEGGKPAARTLALVDELGKVVAHAGGLGLGKGAQAKAKGVRTLAGAAPDVPAASEIFLAMERLFANAQTALRANVEHWRRGLVGRFVEVEWEEGDWWPAVVVVYNNLSRVHGLLYKTLDVERVLFHSDGSATSPDGEDSIAWRFLDAKKAFKVSEAQRAEAIEEALAGKGGAEFDTKDAEADADADADAGAPSVGEVAKAAAEPGRPASAPSTAAPATGTASAARARRGKGPAGKGNKKGKTKVDDFERSVVGSFLRVEWEQGQYFLGYVAAFIPLPKPLHRVFYEGEDGASELLLLRADGTALSESGQETFRWVGTEDTFVPAIDESDEEEGSGSDYEAEAEGEAQAQAQVEAQAQAQAQSQTQTQEQAGGLAKGGKARKGAKKKKNPGDAAPVTATELLHQSGSRRIVGVDKSARRAKHQAEQERRQAKLRAKEQAAAERKAEEEALQRRRLAANKIIGGCLDEHASGLGESERQEVLSAILAALRAKGGQALDESAVDRARLMRRRVRRVAAMLEEEIFEATKGRGGYPRRVRQLREALKRDAQQQTRLLLGQLRPAEMVAMAQEQQHLDKAGGADTGASAGAQAGAEPDKQKRGTDSSFVVVPAATTAQPQGKVQGGSNAPVLPEPPKKVHILDLKLAEAAAAAASANASLAETIASNNSSTVALPALSSLLSMEVHSDEDEAGGGGGGGGRADKKRASDAGDGRDKKKSKSDSEHGALALTIWSGHIDNPPAALRVALIQGADGTVESSAQVCSRFGPRVLERHRLDPPYVLGLLGVDGSRHKVAGRIDPAKADAYVDEAVRSSDRQLLLAAILAPLKSSSGDLTDYLGELAAKARAGVVDHADGPAGLTLYLIPPTLIARFRALGPIVAALAPQPGLLAYACFVVKPSKVPSAQREKMRWRSGEVKLPVPTSSSSAGGSSANVAPSLQVPASQVLAVASGAAPSPVHALPPVPTALAQALVSAAPGVSLGAPPSLAGLEAALLGVGGGMSNGSPPALPPPPPQQQQHGRPEAYAPPYGRAPEGGGYPPPYGPAPPSQAAGYPSFGRPYGEAPPPQQPQASYYYAAVPGAAAAHHPYGRQDVPPPPLSHYGPPAHYGAPANNYGPPQPQPQPPHLPSHMSQHGLPPHAGALYERRGSYGGYDAQPQQQVMKPAPHQQQNHHHHHQQQQQQQQHHHHHQQQQQQQQQPQQHQHYRGHDGYERRDSLNDGDRRSPARRGSDHSHRGGGGGGGGGGGPRFNNDGGRDNYRRDYDQGARREAPVAGPPWRQPQAHPPQQPPRAPLPQASAERPKDGADRPGPALAPTFDPKALSSLLKKLRDS